MDQATDRQAERTALVKRKERAALWSIVASVGITLAKGAAGLTTGSLALISDAAHSLLDVASTTMTWLAVRAADKPADEQHHYGHGKLESLAALAETAFLFLLSGIVAWEGVRRLMAGGAEIQPSWLAVAVLLGAIAVDAWRWVSLKRVARETGSDALDADALHFAADLINSVLVLGALGLAAIGYPQADAAVAIGVSLFIALAGFRLARRTIDTLLDTAPEGVAERVTDAVARVPGVVSVDGVRARPMGGRVMGEVRVRVSRTLPLDRVTAIKAAIDAAIHRELPHSEFTITANPIQLDDETILERVMLIAAHLRVPVHHVTVQEIEGRLSVSFDVEVDGRIPLSAAHTLASRVEAAIQDELGPNVEVESHIEPLETDHLKGREADARTVAAVALALAEAASGIDKLTEVHGVRVRETPSGLVVNYHCQAAPHLDVATVHACVDELERRVRTQHPAILRVIGHAEPSGRDEIPAARPSGQF